MVLVHELEDRVGIAINPIVEVAHEDNHVVHDWRLSVPRAEQQCSCLRAWAWQGRRT